MEGGEREGRKGREQSLEDCGHLRDDARKQARKRFKWQKDDASEQYTNASASMTSAQLYDCNRYIKSATSKTRTWFLFCKETHPH
jgi:hypothetical protein